MKTYTVNGGQVTDSRSHRWRYAIVVLLLVGLYLLWALLRPLPALTSTVTLPAQTKAPAGQLQWPAQGQSAVGIVGTSTLETHNPAKPVPIASTAKLITALMVLQKKPLQPGQQGPTI